MRVTFSRMWQSLLTQLVKRRFQILALMGSVGTLLAMKGMAVDQDLIEQLGLTFLTLCSLIDPSLTAGQKTASAVKAVREEAKEAREDAAEAAEDAKEDAK